MVGPSGAPISAYVEVTKPTGSAVGNASTDSQGRYVVAGLPPGSYAVHFINGSAANLLDEWFDDAATFPAATLVEVVDGQTVSGIDAALGRAGAISGRVTKEDGAPIFNASVSADGETDGPSISVGTDELGRYTIPQLRTDRYVVSFGCWGCLSEFYDNKHLRYEANRVDVVEGHVTAEINAALASSGAISGSVVDSSGRPVPGACVTAEAADTWTSGSIADGSYVIRGLPPGSYTVRFGGECGIYPPRWYPDAGDRGAASTVSVKAESTTTGVNGIIRVWNGLTGAVTDATGNALYGACVSAQSERALVTTSTDAWGRYAFDGLQNGQWTISFSGCDSGPYLRQWYPDSDTPEGSSPLWLGGGTQHDRVDASLDLGGSITGHVQAEEDPSMRDACIDVYDAEHKLLGSTRTDVTGEFRTEGLRGGSYRVLIRPCEDSETVFPEWFEDKPSFDLADPVSVAAGVQTRIVVRLPSCHPGFDADQDGLTDCDEHAFRSNRYDPDTDGDLFSDGIEVHGGTCGPIPVAGGSSPTNPLSTPVLQAPFGLSASPLPHPPGVPALPSPYPTYDTSLCEP